MARQDVPAVLLDTVEFTTACPETAIVMSRVRRAAKPTP
jgi:hypothetical protein